MWLQDATPSSASVDATVQGQPEAASPDVQQVEEPQSPVDSSPAAAGALCSSQPTAESSSSVQQDEQHVQQPTIQPQEQGVSDEPEPVPEQQPTAR